MDVFGGTRVRARMIAAGIAVVLLVAIIGAGAVASGQDLPVEPQPCPLPCYGGLVITEPVKGETEYNVPLQFDHTIRISIDDPEGWYVAFDSDIPVVRVAIAGGSEGLCNVWEYGTDPLVYSD